MTGRTLAAPARGSALDGLVHPVPLAALLLLLVNDHVLKPNHPGWLSGKLSDVAVLVLIPYLVVAAADLVALRWPRLPVPGRRAALAGALLAAALFALIEVTPVGAEAYRWGLGVAQWPVHAVAALAGGQPLPDVRPVLLTADVTDLLTLPFAATILLQRRRSATPSMVAAKLPAS